MRIEDTKVTNRLKQYSTQIQAFFIICSMSENSLKAFVIISFDKSFNSVRDSIRKALVMVGFEVIFSDEINFSNKITDDIERSIRESHLCICDVTGKNPNVAWEFGYAAALRKRIIPIAQSEQDLYFDINGIRTIFYSLDNLTELEISISKFARTARESLALTPVDYAFGQTIEGLEILAGIASVNNTIYDCFNLIAQAQNHVLLAGQNHGFLSQSSGNQKLFKESLTTFFDRSPNARFEVMICDETCSEAIRTWEFVLESQEYERHLNESLLFFSKLKREFDQSSIYKKQALTIKKFNFVPLSILFIDPEMKTGIAVVTPNGFQKNNISKPSFIISKKDNRVIFNSYWSQYLHYFTARKSVELTGWE